MQKCSRYFAIFFFCSPFYNFWLVIFFVLLFFSKNSRRVFFAFMFIFFFFLLLQLLLDGMIDQKARAKRYFYWKLNKKKNWNFYCLFLSGKKKNNENWKDKFNYPFSFFFFFSLGRLNFWHLQLIKHNNSFSNLINLECKKKKLLFFWLLQITLSNW